VLPATPLTPLGAPAGVAGVTAADGAELGPVPTPLRAATAKVYAVPLVRPVTVCVVAVEEKATGIWATPPIEGVTT
jgi:hypothetical protein